ncbi:MAG: HD domain-containing protein [Firmicutes bacterium]|nr:HD domain-containing protein [Bacillota bacterium]
MEQVAKRLTQQISFILEIDQLKQIYRQNLILDGSRRENDAEHSWHLAMMAVVLQEYASEPVDLSRVLQMVLLHDIVEIDAGDTFCYDVQAGLDKHEREQKAAKRIFGLLPSDQGEELKNLWLEFEAGESPEARFAAVLDRLQPFLNNYHTEGGTWRIHGVGSEQVQKRMEPIGINAPALGAYVEKLLEEAIAQGILRK